MEAAVRTIRRVARKKHLAEEKVRIVLERFIMSARVRQVELQAMTHFFGLDGQEAAHSICVCC